MTSPSIKKVTAGLSSPLCAPGAQVDARQITIDSDCLSGIVSALGRKHRVPGAQLAVHCSGETVAVETGELQYGTGQLVTRDAAFPVGSISKAFTATVAMILVADGDLDLDVPLVEYLTDLHITGVPLTLRQLLSHTSGFASDVDSDDLLSISIRRYVLDYCRHENLMLAPGLAFSYSNIGYVLVGYLIERITGMSWWDAVESILLQPLGIDPAFIVGSAAPTKPNRPIATGHSVNSALRRTRPVSQSLDLAMAPAGALAVSAVDLVSFGLLQVDGYTDMLLPTTYAAQMRQSMPGATPFGLADGWGLGLAVFHSGDTVWVGHDGNSDGTACYLRIDPRSGFVIAFTSNASTGLAMWQELVLELGNMGIPITNYSTKKALGESASPSMECLGNYLNGGTEYTVEVQQDGKFRLMVDGTAVANLSFYADMLFLQQDLDSGQWGSVGRFLRNPTTGHIDQMQVNGRLACRQVSSAVEGGRNRMEMTR